MQPQPGVVIHAANPQQPAVEVSRSGLSDETIKERKKIIYFLAVIACQHHIIIFELQKVELAIGCIMVVFGIFTSIYVGVESSGYFTRGSTFYSGNYRLITFGEGIWCGIWVVIAGGLGMGAGGSKSTSSLITSHMWFSIVGALASGVLCGLTATWAAVGYRDSFFCALMSTMSIVSFATVVLLTVSASYCCRVQPAGCCEQQSYVGQQTATTVTYINAPQARPVQGTGITTTSTTYHPQMQPPSGNMYSGNVMPTAPLAMPQQTTPYQHANAPPMYQKY